METLYKLIYTRNYKINENQVEVSTCRPLR